MAYNFTGASKAAGLNEEDAADIEMMLKEFNACLAGNVERKSYYDDVVDTDMLGFTLPENMGKIDTSNGWAAKAVDMLADRSILSGITMDNDYADTMRGIVGNSGMIGKYHRGKTSQLMHCCGFWSIGLTDSVRKAPGAVNGVAINYRDAEQAYGWWDKANGRISKCITIDGWKRLKNGSEVPSVLRFHDYGRYVQLTRTDYNHWTAEEFKHGFGTILIVPMPYRATDQRPFGRSRITRACRSNIQAAKRESIRLEVHSEFHATGQKYALGVDDSMFDLERFTLACNAFLMATRDENGDVPQFGQFSSQSPDGHIAVMEYLAGRMASETNIPVSAFGVLGNGYTSSEALAASSNNLIVEAENMNEANGDALRNVCRIAMAVALNKRLDELDEEQLAVKVAWKDAGMVSSAAKADYATKVNSIVHGYGRTRICHEQLGFDPDSCDRLEAQLEEFAELDMAADILGG